MRNLLGAGSSSVATHLVGHREDEVGRRLAVHLGQNRRSVLGCWHGVVGLGFSSADWLKTEEWWRVTYGALRGSYGRLRLSTVA